MPQVRILFVEQYNSQDYDNEYSQNILSKDISDWEEISPSDLIFLQNNLSIISPYHEKYKPILLIKDSTSILERIKSIKEVIKKQQEKTRTKEEKLKRAKLQKFEKLKQELIKSGDIDVIKI